MVARSQRTARRHQQSDRTTARQAAGRNQSDLVRMRRWRRAIGSWLLTLLAPLLLRALAMTWRVQRRGELGLRLLRSTEPWIISLWHGRMLALMPLRWHRSRQLGVLVSPSDDGALAKQALEHFRYRIVRGSLNRGGARALREMRQLLAARGQLVVTPDGPRGPRHGMNVGVAWLARSSGAPILPIGVAVDRAWRLRSWDRFTIPKPFARLCVVYGDPIAVAADATDAAVETTAQRLREVLLAQEVAAFEALGCTDDLDITAAANGRSAQ